VKLITYSNPSIDPHALARVLSVYDALVEAATNIGQYGITVRGAAETVEEIEQVVRRLDLPVRVVDLTAYVLSAQREGTGMGELPPGLRDAVESLKGAYGYRAFSVIDKMVLRTAERRRSSSVEGSAYGLVVRALKVSPFEDPPTVDLELNVGKFAMVEPPISTSGPVPTIQTPSVHTGLRIRDGEYVAIGQANLDESGGAVVFVVGVRVLGEIGSSGSDSLAR
jgi:hypothetical protein